MLRASLVRRPFLRNQRCSVMMQASESSRAPMIDFRKRAALLGVRLTDAEVEMLQRSTTQNLALTRRKFLRFARTRWDQELERDVLLASIEQPAEASTLTKHVFPLIGVVGTASWSIAGTQVAGEAGMNLVGCAFVGCVAALGGGTLNSLMFGASRRGVHWVRHPKSTVMVALGASMVTFFAWPEICRTLAERWLQKVHLAAANDSWLVRAQAFFSPIFGLSDESRKISKAQFLRACEQAEFIEEARRKLGPQMHRSGIIPNSTPRHVVRVVDMELESDADDADALSSAKETSGGFLRRGATSEYTAEQMFAFLDSDGNGALDLKEITRLVKLEYDGSALRYMFDTIALGASTVTGTASAVSCGLHPIVCVVSSVTMCFGGILRDLLCGREVAIGSQSFALCLAAGASVYVGLRELCLLGVPLPLGSRILLASGTTVTVRLVDYFAEKPLLSPMHKS